MSPGGPDRHTMRVCIVEGVVWMSVCPAIIVTLMPDMKTGPEALAVQFVRQCAAVTTNEGLTIVPPHMCEYVFDSEKIVRRT